MCVRTCKLCFSNHQKQDVFYSLSLFQCTANYVWRKEWGLFASRLPQRAIKLYKHSTQKHQSFWGTPYCVIESMQTLRHLTPGAIHGLWSPCPCCTVHSTTNVQSPQVDIIVELPLWYSRLLYHPRRTVRAKWGKVWLLPDSRYASVAVPVS